MKDLRHTFPRRNVFVFVYLSGWSQDEEINTVCILGPYRDNRTHCGGGYASVGTKNVQCDVLLTRTLIM